MPNPTTPTDPRPPDPTNPRPPGTRTRPGRAITPSWRTWWELNREHLIGLRRMLRQRATVTGKATDADMDPMADVRGEVLQALRHVARKASDRTLRAGAIIALGRMGDDADAMLFLDLLKDGGQPTDVREAAAVGLGIIDARGAQSAIRKVMQARLKDSAGLPTRARGLLTLSTGLRARSDRPLVGALLGVLASRRKMKSDDATNLVYACGLSGDVMLVPELLPVLRKGSLGGRHVKDITRAYAALALGMTRDRNAARLLSAVMGSRSADLHTKRSCALALGRLMRDTELDKDSLALAKRSLLQVLAGDRDGVLRGFAAVALGGAKSPLAQRELMEAIDRGGNEEVKPFCALALGLSARTLGPDAGKRIGAFLLDELGKTKRVDLVSALAVALGLARYEAATKDLLERVSHGGDAFARGAAAQGLGLMAARDPKVHKTLEDLALREKDVNLLEDVVLALGLMGRRGVSLQLIQMLQRSKSSRLQGRIILALGHLDSATAVKPLLDILKNTKERPLVREFAAAALGIIGNRRSTDTLFSVDAYFNFYATTLATNEMVRLY